MKVKVEELKEEVRKVTDLLADKKQASSFAHKLDYWFSHHLTLELDKSSQQLWRK